MTPQTAAPTQASSGSIDEQAALAIALQQAGLTQNDLIRYRVKLRDKHGSLLYRFKLKITGYECEVDVDAHTGAVTKFHREVATRSCHQTISKKARPTTETRLILILRGISFFNG